MAMTRLYIVSFGQVLPHKSIFVPPDFLKRKKKSAQAYIIAGKMMAIKRTESLKHQYSCFLSFLTIKKLRVTERMIILPFR
jgi:hypothetical protein